MLRRLLPLLVLTACDRAPEPTPTPRAQSTTVAPTSPPAPPERAAPAPPPDDLPTVDASLLRTHIAVLASDDFGGRRPGTDGAKKTTAYIEAQMKALGLQPAGEAGTYRQTVPMRGVTADTSRTVAALQGGPRPRPLTPGKEIVIGSYQASGTIHFDAELVFVGYGITAPEESWDDYADIDVRGKIAVVLVGDPPLRPERFGGDAMTYYGRWTYKFERALQAGALGCLVVHETGPASYGWNVVESSWSGERFHVIEPGGALPDSLTVQGWLHADAAQDLATLAGSSLEQWHADARSEDFRGRGTGISLAGEVVTTERELSDDNVLGKIVGDDDDAFVVSAHWDHLGTDESAEGDGDADRIFNGAVDNASGIAGMLATAAALQHRRAQGLKLRHSVVFFATTAEEQGLLGSEYFAGHPTVPLARLHGIANLDSMNVEGPTKTVTVAGAGQTTLEDVLGEVLATDGRTIVPDDRPQAGSYYRSDHFPFAKRGVPALFFYGGREMVDGGRAAGERLSELRSARYHTVDDELDPAWPLTGAVQDVEALTELVVRVDAAPQPPRFKPASEFASIAR